MSNNQLSRQITIVTLLVLTLAILITYLVRSAGLDLKGIVAVMFMTLTFYMLIKR
jgi:hypothetical protein